MRDACGRFHGADDHGDVRGGRPGHTRQADPRGRTGDARRGWDIAYPGVRNERKRSTYYVALTGRFGTKRAQLLRLRVDTGPRSKGPEYRVIVHGNRDPRQQRDAEALRLQEGAPADAEEGPDRPDDPQEVSRGSHRRIRVITDACDVTTYKSNGGWRGYWDGAPGTHEPSGWVRSRPNADIRAPRNRFVADSG